QTIHALNHHMPEGIRFVRMAGLHGKEKSLNSYIIRYIYEVRGESAPSAERFFSSGEMIVARKKGPVNIKDMIEEVRQIDDRTFRLTVRDCGEDKVRLDELVPAIFGSSAVDFEITRTGMYGQADPRDPSVGWIDPIDPDQKMSIR
ncbi:MAG: DUF2344 domain-containing protein, partial [Nitrospiraceae bacterium]|nr:DUF2344 domain-containing protein [Nitrospiraceae bacterium]